MINSIENSRATYASIFNLCTVLTDVWLHVEKHTHYHGDVCTIHYNSSIISLHVSYLAIIKHISFSAWRVPSINGCCTTITVDITTQHICRWLKSKDSNNLNGQTWSNNRSLVLYHIRSLRESDCYPSFSVCLESKVEHVAVFAVAVDTHKHVTGVAVSTMTATFRNSLTPLIGGDTHLYAVNTISVINAGGPEIPPPSKNCQILNYW